MGTNTAGKVCSLHKMKRLTIESNETDGWMRESNVSLAQVPRQTARAPEQGTIAPLPFDCMGKVGRGCPSTRRINKENNKFVILLP